MPVRAIRPRWYWDGREAHSAPVLGITAGGQFEDPSGLPVEDVDGIVLPGLVNAHTHLEVGPAPRPDQRGFLPWLRALQAAGGAYTGGDPERFLGPARSRAAQMHAAGTAVVGDISNTGLTAAVIREAGMTGLCFHERIGIDVPTHPVLPDTIPVPHAVYSTHPDWISECADRSVSSDLTPWCIHVDEDPFEAEFLRGEGPWPGILRAFGRDLADFRYPHLTPVAYLDVQTRLRGAILVHCVCTGPADLDLIASRNATICLCVRSNLWIGGRLPDVQGMVDRGVRLVVGTDSLASSPDLDVLAELAAIRKAVPTLSAERLLRMATSSGFDALTLAGDGLRSRPNAAAPLLLVRGPTDLDELLNGTVWPRSWLGTLASGDPT
ncbi:MAG: hypothetical protein EXR69_08200 [Myxococcales bacterium]|nr:hypothetical protein [Myxococcales bacterium]